MFREYCQKLVEENAKPKDDNSRLVEALALFVEPDIINRTEVRNHGEPSPPPARLVHSSPTVQIVENPFRFQQNLPEFALFERNDRPSPTLEGNDNDSLPEISDSELIDRDLGDNLSTDSEEIVVRHPRFGRGRARVLRVAAPPERRAMLMRSVAVELPSSSDDSRPTTAPSVASNSENEEQKARQGSSSNPSRQGSGNAPQRSSPPQETSVQEQQAELAPSTSAELQSEEQVTPAQDREETSSSTLKPLPFPRPADRSSSEHILHPETPATTASTLFSWFRGRLAPIDRSRSSHDERRSVSFDPSITAESQSEVLPEQTTATVARQDSLTAKLRQDRLKRLSTVGSSTEKKYVEPLEPRRFSLKDEKKEVNVPGTSTDSSSRLPPIQQKPARVEKKKESESRSTEKLPPLAPSTSSESENKSKP